MTKANYALIAATLAIVGLVALPSLVVQQNQPNSTGLPLYPGVTTGNQYPPTQTNEGRYAIYTKDDNQLTHGIVLKNGNDKVLVYQLLQSAGTVIELQKYVGN